MSGYRGTEAAFIAAVALSATCSGAANVVVSSLVLAGRGAEGLGFFLLAVSVSYLLLLMPAGLLTDAVDVGRVLRGAYVVSGAGMLCLLAGGHSLPVIAAAAILMGAGRALLSPAARKATGLIARDGRGVLREQAKVIFTFNLAGILSPLAGGVVVGTGHVRAGTVAIAACYAVAAVVSPRIRPVEDAAASTAAAGEVGAGRRKVLVALPFWVWAGFAQTSLQVLLGFAPGVILLRVRGIELYGAGGFGLLLSVGAGAALVGSVVAAKFIPPLLGGWASAGFVAVAPLYLCLMVNAPLPVLLLAMLVGGIGISLHGVWWPAALNANFPAAVVGRIHALDSGSTKLAEPVGMALTVPAISLLGAPGVCAVCAASFVVFPALALLVPELRTYGRANLRTKASGSLK